MRYIPWIAVLAAVGASIQGATAILRVPETAERLVDYREGLIGLLLGGLLLAVAAVLRRMERRASTPHAFGNPFGATPDTDGDRTFYLVQFDMAQLRRRRKSQIGPNADANAVAQWLAAQGMMQTPDGWLANEGDLAHFERSEIRSQKMMANRSGDLNLMLRSHAARVT